MDPLGDLKTYAQAEDVFFVLVLLYLALVFLSLSLIVVAMLFYSVFNGIPFSKLARMSYNAQGYPRFLSWMVRSFKDLVLGSLIFFIVRQHLLLFVIDAVVAVVIGVFSALLYLFIISPLIAVSLMPFSVLLAYFSAGGYLVVWGFQRLYPVESDYSYLRYVPFSGSLGISNQVRKRR
ncbi:hypothetical protein HYV43_02960 [Candidatus Micrarchaeota archaeon]|nr:hypothetical protein [Candidatus Micrarchaeota archaeon]